MIHTNLLQCANEVISNHHPYTQSVSMTTLREDNELRLFLQHLVSTYLNHRSQYARIDLLHNPVGQGSEGAQLLQQLKEVLNVPVSASADILGAYLSEGGGVTETNGNRCL